MNLLEILSVIIKANFLYFPFIITNSTTTLKTKMQRSSNQAAPKPKNPSPRLGGATIKPATTKPVTPPKPAAKPVTTTKPVQDFSQIKNEEEKTEYFDDAETLDEKVTLLAELVLEAKYTCFFTGAGISTSTGIPDYRSGYGTKLSVGPGCWEKAAYRKQHEAENKNALKPRVTNMQKAYPSLTHMAISEMINKGVAHHIISQNVDGLHRKSGVVPENISELHGNYNKEQCVKCGKIYMRDFHVYVPKNKHMTGRKCDN